MSPKNKSIKYSIMSIIFAVIMFYFVSVIHGCICCIASIMYLIMYKVSDYIDIRHADIIVTFLLPLSVCILLILV